MRKSLLIFFFLILLNLSKGQTVDSIKIEQAGDFIKIGYKILNSTPSQLFRVKVLCSMNGGMNYEIRSITGDIGDNVRGGKQEYWVVWDVLEDVEELGSVEFVIRAEPMSEIRVAGKTRQKKEHGKVNFIAVLDLYMFEKSFFGARAGYFDKWGFTARYTAGSITDYNVQGSVGIPTKISLFNSSIDLVYKVAGDERSGLYILGGPAYGKLEAMDKTHTDPSNYKKYIGFDFGLIPHFRRFLLHFDFTLYPYFNLDDNYTLQKIFFSTGAGYSF